MSEIRCGGCGSSLPFVAAECEFCLYGPRPTSCDIRGFKAEIDRLNAYVNLTKEELREQRASRLEWVRLANQMQSALEVIREQSECEASQRVAILALEHAKEIANGEH